MTLLRRPWAPDLLVSLGEPEEDETVAQQTGRRLSTTSLLEEQVEVAVSAETGLGVHRYYVLHPATVAFVQGTRSVRDACCTA